MSKTVQQIREALKKELNPDHLEILDDSAKHAGHAGAASGGGHYVVTIVAQAFEGSSLVEQHQKVHRALKDLFAEDIHALALNTFTPAQWRLANE